MTEGLRKEPKPFVLQTGLSDYYPEYRLTAAIERPEIRPRVLSALHANIQDLFNEHGIQIMSPHYVRRSRRSRRSRDRRRGSPEPATRCAGGTGGHPMKRTFRILGTTLIRGMVFLIPAVVLVVIVGKALKFTSLIVRPIASLFPVQSVGGLAVASLLAIALVLLICFAAGLWARKSLGFGIVRWLDEKLQDFVPRYTVIKAMAHGFGGDSGRNRLNVGTGKIR